MRYVVSLLLLVLAAALGGCATRSIQTVAYAAPSGETWTIALKEGAFPRTVDLLVGGHVVATSSFAGGFASGRGIYYGQLFSFSCRRNSSECLVYAGGLRLAPSAGEPLAALDVTTVPTY